VRVNTCLNIKNKKKSLKIFKKIINLKKKLKKKKEKEEGWLRATLLTGLGWPNHSPWDGSATPWQNKIKNQGFWPLEVAEPPPMGHRGGSATLGRPVKSSLHYL
jgi:hypothetical protein